jgi:hypothetical protein
MKIFDYWQIASQNLLKNKLRSSLTIRNWSGNTKFSGPAVSILGN